MAIFTMSDLLTSFGGGGGAGGAWHAAALTDAGSSNIRIIAGADDNTVSAQAYLANDLMVWPFVLGRSRTLTAMHINVTTAVGGSNARIGVYASGGASGGPSALLFDSGNVATATTGDKVTSNPSLRLSAGTTYWVAVHLSAAVSLSGTNSPGGAVATNFVKGYSARLNTAFGALPNPINISTYILYSTSTPAVILDLS